MSYQYPESHMPVSFPLWLGVFELEDILDKTSAPNNHPKMT